MEQTPAKTPWSHKFQRHLNTRLVTGILVLTPLVVTYIVLRAVFNFANSLLGPVFTNLPGPTIPGLGFVALLVILYIVGLLATSVFGRRIVDLGHRILGRIPVVKNVYSVTQQAVDVLSSTAKENYKRVVLVDFPKTGSKSIGLVTGQFHDEEGKVIVCLYVPTVPNPTSGFFIAVSEDEVVETDLTVDEAMRIVLSAGILAPKLLSNGSLRTSRYTARQSGGLGGARYESGWLSGGGGTSP